MTVPGNGHIKNKVQRSPIVLKLMQGLNGCRLSFQAANGMSSECRSEGKQEPPALLKKDQRSIWCRCLAKHRGHVDPLAAAPFHIMDRRCCGISGNITAKPRAASNHRDCSV